MGALFIYFLKKTTVEYRIVLEIHIEYIKYVTTTRYY